MVACTLYRAKHTTLLSRFHSRCRMINVVALGLTHAVLTVPLVHSHEGLSLSRIDAHECYTLV